MKTKYAVIIFTIIIFSFLMHAKIFASVYDLPQTNQSLIGHIKYTQANHGDSVSTFARRYDLGRNAILSANPHIDSPSGFYAGMPIKLSTQHLLPNEKRKGIVINLPEMRMYYYPSEGSQEIFTYPIGIGKVGKIIPIEKTIVTRKTKNPAWIPPDDIREFNIKQGIVLPKIMPAGPENPLGPFAIYMGIPTYLIHSTRFPDSIGKRVSFGCIRMYEWDIEEFFPSVTHGIPVTIINSPTKIGWQNKELYLEAHKPLEEHNEAFDASLPGMVHMLVNASNPQQATLIDWQLVSYIAKERDGIPHQVGVRLE